MIEINRKMSDDELYEASKEIADAIQKRLSETDLDHVCSDLIEKGLITILGEISSNVNMPVSEIIKEKRRMFFIMNTRFIVHTMAHAFRRICNPNIEILWNSPHSKAENAERIGELISDDLQLFSCWVIMNGATSDSVRRVLRTKDQQILSNVDKKFGRDGFFSFFIRAASAYNALIDNIVRPACRKMLRGEDNHSVNSMADAFKTIKKGA